MIQQRKSRWIPLAVFLSLFLAGCGGTDKASWSEDVLLHNGKLLVIQSEATRGNSGFPDSRRGVLQSYQIKFSSPEAIWKTDSHAGAVPIAIEIKDGVPYVVVLLYSCGFCGTYGDPDPSLVIWKWGGKQGWERGAYADLPMGTRMNIIGMPWDQKHRDKKSDVVGVWRDLDGHYSLQRKREDVCDGGGGCSSRLDRLLDEYVKPRPGRREPARVCSTLCKLNTTELKGQANGRSY